MAASHHVIVDKARKRISIKDNLLRELLAELGATFLLVVSQFLLFLLSSSHMIQNGWREFLARKWTQVIFKKNSRSKKKFSFSVYAMWRSLCSRNTKWTAGFRWVLWKSKNMQKVLFPFFFIKNIVIGKIYWSLAKFQVQLGWGLIITFCIYTAARTSGECFLQRKNKQNKSSNRHDPTHNVNDAGAHMNPAISFMIYTFGQLTLKKFLLYSLMQVRFAHYFSCNTVLFYFLRF